MAAVHDVRIDFPGDACLSAVFGDAIDPASNARCVALAVELEETRPAGIRDIVPGFHSVMVYFDPLRVDRHALAAEVERLVRERVPLKIPSNEDEVATVIPVHYGGVDGPDLEDVAAFARCSVDDVIRLHAGTTYRVYMLGFLPGFAYLGMVDARIAIGRLDAPRLRVRAGSVGIAGAQTAVYPCDSPGGWRIIGRTDLTMFDVTRANASLLSAGQRVTFVAA